MRQLKSKTAENNMLTDYHYYLQLIHTNTLKLYISIDDSSYTCE